MSNRRERRQILKKMGLLSETKVNGASLGDSIEMGRNKHRQHLQRVKNDLIKQEKERSGHEQDTNEVFYYRNQTNEYSSLQSLLLNRNWKNFESNEDNAE